MRSREDNVYSVVLCAIGAPGLTFFSFHIIRNMLKGSKEKKWAAFNYITNVMWLLIGVSVLYNAQSNNRILRNKMKTIEELAIYLDSECSDKYTVFPKELY